MAVKTSSLTLALIVLVACSSSQERPSTPVGATDEGAPEAPPSEPRPVELAKTEAAPESAPKTEAAPESAPKTEAAPAAASENAEHKVVEYLLPEIAERRSQSPINIVTSRALPSRHKIKFHYQSSKEHVDNLGHTVKVTYDSGSSLDYDGRRYDLVQFHFHTPSEHLLDGVTYPMEMHLVHAEHGKPEHLLVVGVLFKEGDPSPLLDKVLVDVPSHAGEHTDNDVELDASSVLKRGEGYYHYEGSLTTPPYSESVTWLVLDQVHEALAEQIEAMNRIEGNNARHIQDQRARLVDHWH
jgi:carbonic anhydrase